MGVNRQNDGSGEGYVGGFLHLFNWKAKSRKKSFSRSDVPEQSKQTKRHDGNFPMTQLHLIDQDDSMAGSSIIGSSDYSCASSVTDEEVCGSKAPGVVAKLMGLDTLPKSNFSELYSTTSLDLRSLRDAQYCKKDSEFHLDYQSTHSRDLPNKAEDIVRNNVELKNHNKSLSRPLKKFQTETLPPKLAQPIAITHHKLLSPIKSVGFVPSVNAVHVMESASKIFESVDQVNTRTKVPLSRSSVPLKVGDLKEKIEAAKKPPKLADASKRPADSNASAKRIKGQFLNKSFNKSVDTNTCRVSSDVEHRSTGVKNKGKSISLAVQAKANVQKREGVTPQHSSKTSFGQKERSEELSSQPFKSQPSIQRTSNKKPSTKNAPGVLKQNNQKQNCMAERGKMPSKSLSSTISQGRRVLHGDSSIVQQKSSVKNFQNAKVGSRKLGIEVTNDGKEIPHSSTSVMRKKRCIDGDFNFQKKQFVGNSDKNGKAIQSSKLMDRQYSRAEDNSRNGMDVISFTFTTPMTRSVPDPECSREVIENNADIRGKNVTFNPGSANGSRSFSLGYNIGGDALNTLLERKLRKLTIGAESSHHNGGKAANSDSSFQDLTPPLELHDKESGKRSDTINLDNQWGPVFSSPNYEGHTRNYKLQEAEEMSECGSNNSEARNLLDCRHPSPISILEPSVFTESCDSSDTADSNSTEGSKQCSSVQAQNIVDMGTSKMLADTELSDSASSSSSLTMAKNHASLGLTDSLGSTRWELEYVKTILSNSEMMFKDFACGRTCEIISPDLFEQLEIQNEARECKPKLRRKVVFDCVGEFVDLRFRKYAGGGHKAWEKGLSLLRRKEWLAEEVHREIAGWEAMEDCMVDELVDKDMSSSQCGRWLEFDIEAFEMGVEIERRILNSLVNEVISDCLLL